MGDVAADLQDVFRQFGPVVVRKMFGGYGVYHRGVMFALVAEDCLYLKADDANVERFRALGLPQFEYGKAGRVVRMSYYQAPGEMMDDPAEAAVWAREAFSAALRSGTPHRSRARRGPQGAEPGASAAGTRTRRRRT